MTVRLYKSTDASAPTLTGQVGSLVALLDAVLVNGYGSQTAAGWTKAYSGTNTASYRMATSGNTGFYLDVNDNAPSTAKEARMRGYEAMTAVATGTNPFPTVAQSSFGLVCRKSVSADATARVWYIVADGSCFYLMVDTGDLTSPAYGMGFSFGDFFSYKSGDAYNCAIQGRNSENSNSASAEFIANLRGYSSTLNFPDGGSYLARSWTGTGASLNFCKHSSQLAYTTQGNGVMGGNGGGGPLVPYPNGPDGALLLAPVWIGHNGHVRGYMKGLWAPCHPQPLGHGDTFTGTGNMSGKSFLALNCTSNNNFGSQNGQLVLETSDTWS